jgi:hypothetical protein
MLSREKILDSREAINEELRIQGQKGEIGIIGGAVMCLVFNARVATRYVDAIFEPSQIIRKAALKVANTHGLPEDWLNDAAKGFLVVNFKREEVRRFSNLLIWAPEARYMLAMKCISARWDTSDHDDVIFLIKHLRLTHPDQVFAVIQEYYPKKIIPAKTQFFIEEILDT